jgi:hypothetical protein
MTPGSSTIPPTLSSLTRQSEREVTRSPRSKVSSTLQGGSETGTPMPPSDDEDMFEEIGSDDELQSTEQVASKRLVYNFCLNPISSDLCLLAQKLPC